MQRPISERLALIQPGDIVERMLGPLLMDLVVTRVTATLIVCGDFDFDRSSGAEIDDFLQWGPRWGKTGSFLNGRVKPRIPLEDEGMVSDCLFSPGDE